MASEKKTVSLFYARGRQALIFELSCAVMFPMAEQIYHHRSLNHNKGGHLMKIKFIIILLISSIIILPCKIFAQDFTLNSWEVADDDGYASLLIKFDVTDSVRMQVNDPDGVEVDTEYVDEFDDAVYIHLAGYLGTPKSGTYKFQVISSLSDELIFSKEFSFDGPNLSITNVKVSWEWSSLFDAYDIESIEITVKNDGDLPIYPTGGTVEIEDEKYSLYYSTVTVMPGESKTIEQDPFMYVPAGSHSIDVSITDFDNNTIASYSDTIDLGSGEGGECFIDTSLPK